MNQGQHDEAVKRIPAIIQEIDEHYAAIDRLNAEWQEKNAIVQEYGLRKLSVENNMNLYPGIRLKRTPEFSRFIRREYSHIYLLRSQTNATEPDEFTLNSYIENGGLILVNGYIVIIPDDLLVSMRKAWLESEGE